MYEIGGRYRNRAENNHLLLRDNEIFRKDYCENYQTGEIILINISSFGAVINVILDYMHFNVFGGNKKTNIFMDKGTIKCIYSA